MDAQKTPREIKFKVENMTTAEARRLSEALEAAMTA